MEKPARKFRYRTFVDLMLGICVPGLAVTGIANHIHGFSNLTVARHAWMAAHNVLGVLFAACAIGHMLLNRRALWSHIRSLAAGNALASREALAAGAVMALALLFVSHAFHAGG